MVIGALFCVGCGLQGRPASFPVEDIEVPERATDYATALRPDGATGGTGVRQLRAELTDTLTERGQKPEADGALGATASWALHEMYQQHTIDVTTAEAAARHFGFGGLVIGVVGFDMQDQSVWRNWLEQLPTNMVVNRYGIRVSPSGRAAAIVVGATELEYETIPRDFERGQVVTLHGKVADRFAFAHVFLTKPDGTVDEKRMPTRALDASFQLDTVGLYRLEVMGDGGTGPVVISNVPLYVGIAEPTASGPTGAVADPPQAEARMLVLVNEARRSAGVGALAPDSELRDLALQHTEDMVDHHFFSHVSQRTGTTGDRAKRSGILASIFGENIAMAPTAENAHEGLMNSPGHRANMLRPEFTHVGIAAAKGDNALVITMVFGRRPKPADLPGTAAQVEAAVAALRASKGVATVSPDPVYREAAQAGADELADGGDPKDVSEAIDKGLQRAVQRHKSGRPGACSLQVQLLELSQLSEIPALTLPSLRRFGVGAHPFKSKHGASLATVLMLEGVPCS
jgi:uncharacterized protein YkwD